MSIGKTSFTTFDHFCQYVRDCGGNFKSGFAVDADGHMYSFVVLLPKPESGGIEYMIEGVGPNDRISQKVILSAKRQLKLFV